MNLKLIAGLSLLSIVLIIVIFLLQKQNIKSNQEKRVLTETVIASQDVIRITKDENGKLYQTKEALVIDYNKIKNTNDELVQLVEKQRKELKIRPKDIQYVNVETTKIDTILKTVVKDSCYTYVDNWNNLAFCKDWSYIHIEDSISSILYTDKYILNPSKVFFIRWFQKKSIKYELNITHTNPLVKTTNLKTIIKPKNK